MPQELVTYELDGRIALIGLNRPDKRNAINEAVIDALRVAVHRAGEESDVAVLFGHGSNFCSGLDLGEALARAAGQATPPRKGKRHSWHEVFDTIARGPVPFVSALHGAVVGGGLEIACATHLRVADESAFFGLPEGQRGIFVGGSGSARIPRLIGVSRMTDMMLTGRVFDAAEGHAAGFSNYLVDEGHGLAKAIELARKVAGNAPLSNYAITQALPRIADMSTSDGLFVESLMSAIAQGDEAAKQRVRDFLAKRAGKVGKAP